MMRRCENADRRGLLQLRSEIVRLRRGCALMMAALLTLAVYIIIGTPSLASFAGADDDTASILYVERDIIVMRDTEGGRPIAKLIRGTPLRVLERDGSGFRISLAGWVRDLAVPGPYLSPDSTRAQPLQVTSCRRGSLSA